MIFSISRKDCVNCIGIFPHSVDFEVKMIDLAQDCSNHILVNSVSCHPIGDSELLA